MYVLTRATTTRNNLMSTANIFGDGNFRQEGLLEFSIGLVWKKKTLVRFFASSENRFNSKDSIKSTK